MLIMCNTSQNAVPLEPRVKQLVSHIVPQLIEMYETEDNKYVLLSRSVAQCLLASAPCDERFNSAHFDARRARETLNIDFCSLTFPTSKYALELIADISFALQEGCLELVRWSCRDD